MRLLRLQLPGQEQAVGWLELFFDLVYVATIIALGNFLITYRWSDPLGELSQGFGHCSILVDTRPPQRPKLGRELVLGQVRNALD